jgi:hypothetical protein
MSVRSRRQIDSFEAGSDTQPASGAGEWVEAPRREFSVFMAELLTLVGGTAPEITFKVQESSDKVTAVDVVTLGALSAAGVVAKRVAGTGKRWLRIAWTTTGTPDSATADLFIAAR